MIHLLDDDTVVIARPVGAGGGGGVGTRDDPVQMGIRGQKSAAVLPAKPITNSPQPMTET